MTRVDLEDLRQDLETSFQDQLWMLEDRDLDRIAKECAAVVLEHLSEQGYLSVEE